jgi:hypothetical protein
MDRLNQGCRMRVKNDVSKRLRVQLLAAMCAAMCTVPALASSLDRIDRESHVAVGKQMLAADPSAGAAALPPATSAEPRFRTLSQALPQNMRGKVLTAEGLARTHLGQLDGGRAKRASADLLQLQNVSSLRNGAQIISFGTQVQGVEVFRRSVDVLIDGDQTLRAISGVWPPVQEQAVAKASLAWSLHAEDALAFALEGYGFERTAARAAARPLQMQGGYLPMSVAQTVAGANGERVQSSRAKQVLFPLAGKLIPAWYVETVVGLDGRPEADYYAHVVSADDGEILFRHRQSEDAVYKWNVWADASSYVPFPGPHGRNDVPYPSNTPSGTIPSTVPPNVVTLENAQYSQNDPWLTASATATTGNNAEAYIDLNNDGYEAGFDFRSPVFPEAGPDPAPYDPALDPAVSQAQREAAVRQMFYLVNWTHDWYYDSGFDEASGNAQDDNFGRGGLGGDSIRAEGQDNTNSGGITCAPNCADNANMATPADGGRPRMQMYTFSPTSNASFSITAPSAETYRVGLPGWSALGFDVSGNIVQAQDGSGTPAGSTTTDGCTAYTNAAAVTGNIAFVDRGNCDFVVKTQRAIDAGAIGVLIGNVATSNSPGTPPVMGCTTGPCPTLAFPALSINLQAANALRSALGDGTPSGRMLRQINARPDGTIDNQIMAHELGHYISNRLVENASGLTTNMSRGMVEGWGDFHGLLLTVRPEDINSPANWNWSGLYPLATYATGDFFYGLRRYPYSTNFLVNPLTLKHIQTGIPLPATPEPLFTAPDNAEVHRTGEVWATALWECYVSLLNAHPFSEAQDRMKSYLINGYKLTPAAPLITEARDAILAVAIAQDSADFQRFTQAFARRGLGIGAQTPDRFGTTNAGTVESFARGGRVAFGELTADDNGTCDDDGVLDNGESGVLTLRWNNIGWTPLVDSVLQISSDYPGLTFSGNSLGSVSVPSTAVYTGTDVQVPVELVGAPANGIITFTVTAFDPALSVATSTQLTLRVDYDDTPDSSATETFDASPLAWNLRLTDGATALKDWRVTSVAGSNVAQAPAAGAVGVAWIESPAIAVGNSPFSVTLNHRYSFESDGTHYDGGVVELSTDGGTTWNPVTGSPSIYGGVLSDCCSNPLQGRQALVAASAGYPAFTTTTLDLGTSYSGQTVRLRFGLAEDEAVGTAGWDIDTVTLSGATNTPFPRRGWQTQTCPGATTADIVVPALLSATAPFGGTTTSTLAIANRGLANLHWSIDESVVATCDQPGDVGWLSVATSAGTTLANTTSNVTLTFNAANLGAGSYTANLCIDNNDPTTPRATVPVTFSVSNVAPTFVSTPVTDASEGAAYTYPIAVTDPAAGDTLTITANQKPAWLTLTATPGSRTASLTGTPTAADAGSHAIVLVVSDGSLSTQQNFTVTVNVAPDFTSTPVTAAVQESAYTYAVTATDANAGDVLTITAPTRPTWLTLTPTGNGTATLTGTPHLADLGNHDVVLHVIDAEGLVAEQSFSITVTSNNTAPLAVGNIQAQVDDEGDAITLDVSTAFDDADANDVLTYTATGLPPGLTIDNATGIISGILDFESAGSYNVTVTATDPANAFATQSFAWTVNYVVLPPPIFGNGFEGN